MNLSRKVELAKQYIDLIAADDTSPAEEVKAAMGQVTDHAKNSLAAAAKQRAARAQAAADDAAKLA